MKSGKDEAKPMGPLFSRLNSISDADKGGQMPPSRNKLALWQRYDAPSENPRFNSGSMKMLPVRARNDHSSFAPQASSSQVGGSVQKKVLPAFLSLSGSSNYQIHKYNSSRCEDEIDYKNMSKDQSGMNQIRACLKQPKELRNKGQSSELEKVMRKRCASYPKLEYSSELVNIGTIKNCSGDGDFGSLQVKNVDKKQETSHNTKVADYVSVLDLCPDDVVGAIGQKLFWKARNTILRQQRTFAMQIFELHRLIKVQRFIARSPQVLHENNFNPPTIGIVGANLGQQPIPFARALLDGYDTHLSKFDAKFGILHQSWCSVERKNEQSVRVIKVVPRDPQLASESAARIFRSIQEETSKT